ncbi:MAG: Urease accessory protein ureE [Alphaproteobacteria bacterium]|nr:Urease accessory protein ureE [Alphaproteobacteria bacterium]
MAIRVTQVVPQGSAAGAAADTVSLDFDGRHRRRMMLHTESGEDVLLDLAETVALADGDLLITEEGRQIRVVAKPEALMEVSAADPARLARLAWHIGNRHLPTEIAGATLYLRHDHVIAAMLERLGASVRFVDRPFNPEGGAYGHGRTHGHDHSDHEAQDHHHDGHHHHDHHHD